MKAAAKKAQAAAEMAGFDPYVTTSYTAQVKATEEVGERRGAILASSEGGQAAQVGRKVGRRRL
jgi:hypothetical protein